MNGYIQMRKNNNIMFLMQCVPEYISLLNSVKYQGEITIFAVLMTDTLLISATFLLHVGYCISSFLIGLFNRGYELMHPVTFIWKLILWSCFVKIMIYSKFNKI